MSQKEPKKSERVRQHARDKWENGAQLLDLDAEEVKVIVEFVRLDVQERIVNLVEA